MHASMFVCMSLVSAPLSLQTQKPNLKQSESTVAVLPPGYSWTVSTLELPILLGGLYLAVMQARVATGQLDARGMLELEPHPASQYRVKRSRCPAVQLSF